MIRRDFTAADGTAGWLLLKQIDHAHLAGELADAWQFRGLESDAEIDALRTAAHCHDDGWRDWDRQPGIDDKTGRPVNFDEMRLADSLAIWAHSIVQAAARGPLVGYYVAGHFTRLLRRFDSWQKKPDQTALAVDFLDRHDRAMITWLDQSTASHAAAERGVAYLQHFDAISLWLCCAERHEPQRLEMAGGDAWTFSPRGVSNDHVQAVRVEPWPLAHDQFELSVTGLLVPRRSYRSTDELLAAKIKPPVRLAWTLFP